MSTSAFFDHFFIENRGSRFRQFLCRHGFHPKQQCADITFCRVCYSLLDGSQQALDQAIGGLEQAKAKAQTEMIGHNSLADENEAGLIFFGLAISLDTLKRVQSRQS